MTRPPSLHVPPRIKLAGYEVGDEEVEVIRSVLESGVLTGGPRNRAFEEAFAALHEVEHAVTFANGTVALAGIYLGLGIGSGDEVIVPSLTFISTATSVLHAGAEPVFADVDPETFDLDPADVARRITPRTKAIVAVHYGGQPCDLDELRAVADEARVHLIEDAAQAHGASYKGRPVGGFGAAAMFSFTPTKNITMGEGGVVTTNSGELAERLRLLRNHGQRSTYEHVELGFNWRLTEIQAAMGEVQLGRLDGILARKRANAEVLDAALASLPGITPPVRRADRDHVLMLYTTLVDGDRDRVMAAMNEAGIECRLYFPPAHRQPVFVDRGHSVAELPVTEELARRMMSLPFHARLTSEDLDYMLSTLSSVMTTVTR
jgi:perosamine synthetase